jgi:putative membrane protein
MMGGAGHRPCLVVEGKSMRLLLIWILNALALLTVANLMPGIHIDGFEAAMVAALFLGFVNTLIRPVLLVLTLPATLLTLGLFIFVINGLLFWFIGSVLKGFVVDGFWYGVAGAMLYSFFSWGLQAAAARIVRKHEQQKTDQF